MVTRNLLMKLFYVLTGCIFSLMPDVTYGQQKRIDSLRLQLKEDSAYIYRPKKVKVLLSLDQRNTFVQTSADENTPVFFRGVKMGVTVFDRHKTGIGFYSLVNSSRHVSRVNGQPVDIDFTLRYITLFYEYYFIHTRRWDLGVPFDIGAGKYRTIDPASDIEGVIFPLGTGIDVHYKPIRWASIFAMGGYRQVINNYTAIDLSNWFYAFGVSLNTRNIYDDSRYYLKKKKFKKEVAKLKRRKR